MPPSTTSFFQIIIYTAFQERKLKFPNKFVQEHGKKIPDMVRLSIPTGRCWDVRLEREIDGTIWLRGDGFLNFTEDNGIGIENFLVFKYDCNSEFLVHIFDLTATEILYNCSRYSERCNVVNELQMDEIGEESADKDSHDPGSVGNGSDEDSYNSTADSLKSQSVHEISDDDDDSFRYESGDEISGSRGVDSPEHGSGDKDSDDSSIEYLGSTIDGLLPQVFPEPSEFASNDKRNEGCSRETTRSGLCYGTRTKRKLNKGSLEEHRSMCTGSAPNKFGRTIKQPRYDRNNISPRDISKEVTARAKQMQQTVPNSFRVTIRAYHTLKGFLRLSSIFARLHMGYKTTLIKLVDTNNKEWKVSCIHRGYNYTLSKGWTRFVHDMGLVVGDICVFKHIGSDEDVKLKVNIIKRRLRTSNPSDSRSHPEKTSSSSG